MEAPTSPNDRDLERRTQELQLAITDWLMRHDLWFDCCFKPFAEHFGEYTRPLSTPVVLVLCFEGPLFDILHGYTESWATRDAFDKFIESIGYSYECEDGTTLVFMPSDDELSAEYKAYYDFRWLCHAILPSYVDLNAEVYEHFSRHPEDLRKLPPRDFEVLLDAIFRNHGYRTALGPGSNDGGVDIRIYQDDHVGELVTLVQVKRYAVHRPIELEAVAALQAIVDDERANRGLFVTTSRFLPVAQRFADKQRRKLILADSSHVQQWCSMAADRIALPHRIKVVSPLNKGMPSSLVGTVFHGHSRGGRNRFSIVVKHVGNTVFVCPIACVRVHPAAILECAAGRIWEAPVVEDGYVTAKPGFLEANFYISRLSEDGTSFWTDHTIFRRWDGTPTEDRFDWWD